ncbi:MAG: hypothetical protein HN413_03895 [Chloroflexi bacterium]|jgi:hypothetical protein|nr:hypothetical protein [Chloroflexota bacterium]
MKTPKLLGSLVVVLVIALVGASSVLADAPAPPEGEGNVGSFFFTGFGSGGSTEYCFDLPTGWASPWVRFWHTADQEWVDLATEFKTVDGVKKACAVIPANGWIALQGKQTTDKVDPESPLTECERKGNCPVVMNHEA